MSGTAVWPILCSHLKDKHFLTPQSWGKSARAPRWMGSVCSTSIHGCIVESGTTGSHTWVPGQVTSSCHLQLTPHVSSCVSEKHPDLTTKLFSRTKEKLVNNTIFKLCKVLIKCDSNSCSSLSTDRMRERIKALLRVRKRKQVPF